MTRRMTPRTHGGLQRRRALVCVVGAMPARAQRAFDPPELLSTVRLTSPSSFYHATPERPTVRSEIAGA
jgi:hypothetical protein